MDLFRSKKESKLKIAKDIAVACFAGLLVVVIAVLTFSLICGVSFGIITGIIYGICWCFGWTFTYKIALGVWLIMFLAKMILGGNSSESRS